GVSRRKGSQRRSPVCPSEYRPGWGHTQSPCGPAPTGILAISLPSAVLSAYTDPDQRPESQSTLPSAETFPMSGLPPPGMRHFATTRRVRNEIREIEPSPRLVTYR